MIKAVIFDLDDTLISEYDYIKSGYKVITKKIKKDFKLKKSEEDIFGIMWKLFEDNSKNVFNILLETFKLDYNEEYIKELVQAYREHIPNIKFYDDVLPCLNRLKNQEIKLGMITDGYVITQKHKLEVLNAYTLFDKIIITDELGEKFWKPSPKAFEIMRDFFNIKYEEMVYIGDNPKKDFYIKKYYPINTVRVHRKNSVYENEKYLENFKEDAIITELTQIEKNLI